MADEPAVDAALATKDGGLLRGTWRKVTFALVTGILTFASGAWELGNKALDNFQNRSTVVVLNDLALRALERGEYAAAEGFLSTAITITPSSVRPIETRAALKTLQLVAAQYKAGDAVPDDIVEQLEEVGLSRDEANFCIAVCTYSKGGTPEVRKRAEGYLSAITDAEPRLALLKRSRLAGQVLLPQIGEQTPLYDRSTIVNRVKQLLAELDERLPKINGTSGETIQAGFFSTNRKNEDKAFIDGIRREVFTIRTLVEGESLKIACIKNPNAVPANGQEQQLLVKLQEARESVPVKSPLAESIGEQIVNYSNPNPQTAADALPATSTAAENSLESLRSIAVKAKQAGKWAEARKTLGDVVTKAKGADSETLYKTYFNLALIAEYHENNLDQAEEYFTKAEEIRSRLKIADPSLPNTFGYFWYKRARDTHDAGARKVYAEKSRIQLQKALAINPGYSKSINTLDGLQRLLESPRGKGESAS